MCDILKYGLHLEKWVTLEEIDYTWKSVSHLKKWVTLEEKGHT